MNHSIPLDQAKEMVTLYRQNRKTMLAPHLPPDTLAISETFDMESIQALLKQPGCAQVRVYYGMMKDMTVHAILVAADAEGKDILPTRVAARADGEGEEDEGVILEEGIRCPQQCPPDSELFP